MYGYRRGRFEEALIGDGMALVIILVIIALAVIATIIVATVKEMGRIAKASTTYSEASKRVVRMVFLGFAGVLLLCGLLVALVPAATAASIYTAAWSFLVVAVMIEICDWRERKEGRGEDLDSYIDFSTDAAIPAGSNGHATKGHHAGMDVEMPVA